jgi:hypothetical protein
MRRTIARIYDRVACLFQGFELVGKSYNITERDRLAGRQLAVECSRRLNRPERHNPEIELFVQQRTSPLSNFANVEWKSA